MALKMCENCKGEFDGRGAQRYCSEACKAKAQVKVKKCVVCEKEHTRKSGKTCSNKCQVEYTKRLYKEKTGYDSPFQDPRVKAKIAETNTEKYGCANPSQSPEIKLKKEITTMKNFGVKNPGQSEIVKQKMRETCREKYNCDHPGQSPEVIAKREATCEKIFGVKNVFQNPVIKEKIVETNNIKYNCDYPLQNNEIKAKVNATNQEKYSANRFTQTEDGKNKLKETTQERYNEDNVSKLQWVKDKIRNTNLEKYNRPYAQLRHIKNYENFNEEYIKANFTTQGVVTLEDRMRFQEYFGISDLDNALKKLKSLNIECELSLSSSMAQMSVCKKLQEKYPELTFIENDRSVIRNPETGNQLEIDILVKKNEEIVCGIEYNGIKWHDKENPVKEELKTRLCSEKGIKLFHIWEDTESEDFAKVVEFLETR